MRIRQYEVLRRLGKGGTAEVMLVRDRKVDRLFAMKHVRWTPNSEDIWEKAKHDSFEKEKRILAKLKHYGIPAFREAFEEQGMGVIVMRYVQGRTLKALMERQELTEDRLTLIVLQTARIFSYLHRQEPEILFYDLKPSNIMVEDDGTVVLIDFGSCTEKGSAEELLMGTLRYAGEDWKTGNEDRREMKLFSSCFLRVISETGLAAPALKKSLLLCRDGKFDNYDKLYQDILGRRGH